MVGIRASLCSVTLAVEVYSQGVWKANGTSSGESVLVNLALVCHSDLKLASLSQVLK